MDKYYYIFLFIIVVIGITYIFLKEKVKTKIRKTVALAYSFAEDVDMINKNKLQRAVSFVELAILDATPKRLKGLVDYLIDRDYIVNSIEGYITHLKATELFERVKNEVKEKEEEKQDDVKDKE